MKKGFTLIELLAVIAILAVLAIVAVPSVINMYKDAKQKTFVTQAKNIYKGAESKYMSDQLDPATAGARTYCHDAATGNDATETKLDLSGNKNVYYKITISASGNVTAFQVLDGNTYSITKTGSDAAPINATDLTATDGVTVTSMSC